MSEQLYVVDEKDLVIKGEDRKIVHSSKLWHRGAHIILKNKEGKILLQQRSPKKDKFPGKLDISVSEHVAFGESYEEAAKRGLMEELKVSVPLEEIAYFRMQYGDCDLMVNKFFRAEYAGQLELSEETEKLIFFGEEELKAKLEKDPQDFAPWTKELLKFYFGIPSELIVFDKK